MLNIETPSFVYIYTFYIYFSKAHFSIVTVHKRRRWRLQGTYI
jgi:hypothetical protein